MPAAQAYHDESGQPRVRTSIVAFVDLLGFSSMSTACVDLAAAQRTLTMVAGAINDSRNFVRQSFAQDFAPAGSECAV